MRADGARTARIGVMADSHVGEYLPRLPTAALEALEGVDMILHAGDLTVASVLDELGVIAPVVAVRGDHDRGRLDGLELPEALVLDVAGARIGLVHGRRTWFRDAGVVAAHVAAGRRLGYWAGLHRWAARRLGPVDCVVYGHWHDPAEVRVGSTLCFSPGAVCPFGSMQLAERFPRGPRAIGDRGVARFRHQLGREAMRPSVGILEVGSSGVRPRRVTFALDPAEQA